MDYGIASFRNHCMKIQMHLKIAPSDVGARLPRQREFGYLWLCCVIDDLQAATPTPLHITTPSSTCRGGRGCLGDRVIACHNTIQHNLYDLGTIIPTDDRTPDAIAHEIVALVAQGVGTL